jgi:hypothetical protein
MSQHAYCDGCGKHGYLMPLHGDKGGPLRCLLCSGEWHAEHGKRRRLGRIVIRAIKAYMDGGGSARDIHKLKDSALFGNNTFSFGDAIGHILDPLGYMADTVDTDGETVELTSELLADTLKLVHPDMQPPEREKLARRVTQGLLALQPFVFPAPNPKPVMPYPPPSPRRRAPEPETPSSKTVRYPCKECASTTPYFYCDTCKAERVRRRDKEKKSENRRQREWYLRRRNVQRYKQPPVTCGGCGKPFKPKRADTKHCSAACRQRAHRMKRNGSINGYDGALKQPLLEPAT